MTEVSDAAALLGEEEIEKLRGRITSALFESWGVEPDDEAALDMAQRDAATIINELGVEFLGLYRGAPSFVIAEGAGDEQRFVRLTPTQPDPAKQSLADAMLARYGTGEPGEVDVPRATAVEMLQAGVVRLEDAPPSVVAAASRTAMQIPFIHIPPTSMRIVTREREREPRPESTP